MLEMLPLHSIQTGQVVQIPSHRMELFTVLGWDDVTEGVVCRPLQQPQDFGKIVFVPDTEVALVDIKALAQEAKRLSDRGTQARVFLVALAIQRGIYEVHLDKTAIDTAKECEIHSFSADDGGVSFGIRKSE